MSTSQAPPAHPFLRQRRRTPDTVVEDRPPRPTWAGTSVFLLGLVLTGVIINTGGTEEIEKVAAAIVGVSLGLSALFDIRAGGVRNLIRADLFALLALYFLTLFESFFPQMDWVVILQTHEVVSAITVCLWGYGSIAVGRHLTNLRKPPFKDLFIRPAPRLFLVYLFWFCFFVGFLHMLVAVNFNVLHWVWYMLEPRFNQPWGRGRFGNWKALLNELGLLLYLLPPIAGIIFARRHAYPRMVRFCLGLGFAFLIFYGFTSGTRNVFVSFLLTFLIAYSFALHPSKRKELYTVAAATAAMLILSTVFMLEFRQMGLRNYVMGRHYVRDAAERTLFVDNNLYAIARIVEVFPRHHPYLGLELPYQALIRPIPRALWKGKPEGLSVRIEDTMEVDDITISASYVGEAYMGGGVLAVVVIGLFFGFLSGWWSRLASPRNSDFGILVYASGFFAAAISMRSILVFTTAILPTFGALVLGSLFIRKVKAIRQAHRRHHPAVQETA